MAQSKFSQKSIKSRVGLLEFILQNFIQSISNHQTNFSINPSLISLKGVIKQHIFNSAKVLATKFLTIGHSKATDLRNQQFSKFTKTKREKKKTDLNRLVKKMKNGRWIFFFFFSTQQPLCGELERDPALNSLSLNKLKL